MRQPIRSRTFRTLKLGLLFAVGLLLVGCQSKNPMDYLPQASAGYMGMNMSLMRESEGLKRLKEKVQKFQPGSADLESDKAQKVYMGFDMPANAGTAPPMYGVALGTPGFADEVVQKYKASGATESKMAGRETYTSGSVSISPVGKSGILIFQDSATLERMVAVSKKKQPGAQGSPEFAYVSSMLDDHALVLAGKAKPLIDMAGPMMAPLQATNPQAVNALKQVTMVSMAFNWDKQPVIELMLHLSDKAQSDALAAMINTYLGFAKNLPMITANANWAKVVGPLQATAGEDGVRLKIEVPADVAEQLFQQIDTMSQHPQMAPPGAGFGQPGTGFGQPPM